MLKLSGVIITFNEERNIEQCLQSLVNIVDEIIVVDSFSTDKTKSICQRFNGKTVFGEMTFYPSDARKAFYPEEYNKIIGDYFKLPKLNSNNDVIKHLEDVTY